MNQKKEPGRFSIKFNTDDPGHKIVVDLLNSQGSRRKAQFVANAVLHYIHCSDNTVLTTLRADAIDCKYIESVVLDVLKNQNITTDASHGGMPHPALGEESTGGDVALAPETLAAVANTLAAFRGQK